MTFNFLFTLLFIAGLTLSVATRYYLASRHIRHIASHRDQVPTDFASKITLADHRKAADYTMTKLRLGLFEIALSAVILIGFTFLGGLQWVHNFTLEILGPGILQQIALLISISLITGIIDLPFSWYRHPFSRSNSRNFLSSLTLIFPFSAMMILS